MLLQVFRESQRSFLQSIRENEQQLLKSELHPSTNESIQINQKPEIMNLNYQLLIIIFIMAAFQSVIVKGQNVRVTDGHFIEVDGAHRYLESAREELRHDSFDKAPEAFQQYYLDIHFYDTIKISALFEDINNMADQIPVSLENAPLNERTLANITVPVLLIWGDRDFYFPMDVAVELYQLLPNAKLWVIPDQGHTPVWTFMGGDEMAERDFTERIKLFLGNPDHQQ
jgi:pimeloyl-ACP methyl ester carboxylesterase